MKLWARVGGWVKKVQKYVNVVYEWALKTKKYSQKVVLLYLIEKKILTDFGGLGAWKFDLKSENAMFLMALN